MIYYFISYIWKNFVRGVPYSQSELTGFKWIAWGNDNHDTSRAMVS